MRAYLTLRSIVIAVREWWRKQSDVPRAHDQGVGEVLRTFDYNVAARMAFDSRRLIGMQDSPSNRKPVKPIGRVA